MTKTFGIDISSYSGKVDWKKITRSLNPRFAFTRAYHMGATKDACYPDSRFDEYWSAFAELKLPRGAYLFCHPAADAQASVDHLFEVYKPRVGDLLPTLDIEDIYDNDCGIPLKTRINQIAAMVGAVSSRIGGQKPMIYTKARVWADLGNPKQFSDCPLWVIDYDPTHKTPALPPAWKSYQFWQYNHDLKIDGIEGDYDPDYFNGSESQLGEYTIKKIPA